MRRGFLKLAAIAALGLGRAASAEESAKATAAAPSAPPAADAPAAKAGQPVEPAAKADRPVRIRASHRVDVIAPHERVETIIDRMRARGPAKPTARELKPVERLPARPPDGAQGPAHGPGERGRARDVPRPNTNGVPPAERR